MSSKTEAANGRGKGVSFSKLKANKYHKRQHGSKIDKCPTLERPKISKFAVLV